MPTQFCQYDGCLEEVDARAVCYCSDHAVLASPGSLLPIDPLALVRGALVELGVAERASLPSDDQIIMGHVRIAIALLEQIAGGDRR